MKSTATGMLFAMTLLITTHTLAHNIIGFVYTEGWEIEGEIGFSDGQLAPPNALVEVFDPDGKKLGETRTKTNGTFHYTATSVIAHHFKANLGSGHAIELILEAQALPDAPSSRDKSALNTAPTTSLHTDSAGNLNEDQLKQLISEAVSRQVTPLRRDLINYQNQAKWHDVLGGIGYILGIFGLAAWLTARKQKEKP
ncbi:MAG: cobalt ABC transporter permease [Gammaproteobacteria bacterium]|nr:cobalt ABC transporter permease [Gammaproteobacteria bacterium]